MNYQNYRNETLTKKNIIFKQIPNETQFFELNKIKITTPASKIKEKSNIIRRWNLIVILILLIFFKFSKRNKS